MKAYKLKQHGVDSIVIDAGTRPQRHSICQSAADPGARASGRGNAAAKVEWTETARQAISKNKEEKIPLPLPGRVLVQ